MWWTFWKAPPGNPRGFRAALDFLLPVEGGYSHHAWDRGGPTNHGVTQTTYDFWRDRRRLPRRPVSEIDEPEVEAVYREEYWYRAQCDRLPWPVSLVHFDTAVHSGPGRAARLLQRALGMVPDGIIGPVTRRAIKAEQPHLLALRYCKVREEYLKRLAQMEPDDYAPALRGWLNRLGALCTVIRVDSEGA